MACKTCGTETVIGINGQPESYCQSCQPAAQNPYPQRPTGFVQGANGEISQTFKFRTIVFFVLGLIVPLWIISLPLFWYLAYQSYIAGSPAGGVIPNNDYAHNPPPRSVQSSSKTQTLHEIKQLKELLDCGAISESEFAEKKAKMLSRV